MLTFRTAMNLSLKIVLRYDSFQIAILLLKLYCPCEYISVTA